MLGAIFDDIVGYVYEWHNTKKRRIFHCLLCVFGPVCGYGIVDLPLERRCGCPMQERQYGCLGTMKEAHFKKLAVPFDYSL